MAELFGTDGIRGVAGELGALLSSLAGRQESRNRGSVRNGKPTMNLYVALTIGCLLFGPTHAGSQAAQPAPLWVGMTSPNKSYSWLRPPDKVLLSAANKAYDGEDIRLGHYSYPKNEYKLAVGFTDDPRHTACDVVDVELSTPVYHAAELGNLRRAKFEPRPTLAELGKLRGRVWLMVTAAAFASGDAPRAAIFYRGKFLKPAVAVELAPLATGRYCSWYNFMVFEFRAAEGESLAGVGEVVLRWGKIERRISVNFDYLW